MKLRTDRPALHRHAVTFCCDDRYLPFAAFAAHQLIALSEDSFDIVLCSTTLLDLPERLRHPRIRLAAIDVGDMFAGLHRDARRNDMTYLRLALTRAFEGEYTRILYLDSDIFVKDGAFADLLALDLKGNAAGAVRDTRQWRTPTRKMGDLEQVGIPSGPYFNAGVLLMDVESFNRERILDELLAFGAKHGANLKYADQTLLNCVLQGRWAELSPVWNWQFSWSARLFEPMVGANILHFIGPDKPWRNLRGHVPPKIASQFAQFLAQHFPDRDRPKPASPLEDLRHVRKMMFRSILSAHRMRRYLARFPEDRTVH